jgi:hypothetical protein
MASEDNSRILDELEAFYDRCLREREVIVPDFEGHELQEGFQFLCPDGTPSSLEEIEAELKRSCASKGAQLISRGRNLFRSQRYSGPEIVCYARLACDHER